MTSVFTNNIVINESFTYVYLDFVGTTSITSIINGVPYPNITGPCDLIIAYTQKAIEETPGWKINFYLPVGDGENKWIPGSTVQVTGELHCDLRITSCTVCF